MSKNPSWLDKQVARWMTGQIPAEGVLAALAVGALIAAVNLDGDEYLRDCAVEVSVGSLFFLALYFFRIARLTPGVAAALLSGGIVFGVAGWLLSRAQLLPLASAFLLKLASSAILFLVIELLLRGILLAAEKRNEAMAKSVQMVRLKIIEHMKASIAARKGEDFEDSERRAPMDPDIPEPLFNNSDEPIPWTLVGLFGWKQPEGE